MCACVTGVQTCVLPISHQRSRIGIGFVPQGRHIFPHLTVRENLEVGLSALARKGFKGPKAVPEMVFDLFPKLTQIAGRKAGVLSGGEQQQLAIGRALAGQPQLLLLDEPTEGIQPNIVQRSEEHTSELQSLMRISYADFCLKKKISTIQAKSKKFYHH